MVTVPAARGVRAGPREAGYALLLALFVLFILAFALTLLGESLVRRMREVRQDAQTIALVALSDAALAETLSNLSADPFFPGVAEHPFGGGTLASRVRRIGPHSFRVVATARYAERRRSVEAQVERYPAVTWVTWWRRIAD